MMKNDIMQDMFTTPALISTLLLVLLIPGLGLLVPGTKAGEFVGFGPTPAIKGMYKQIMVHALCSILNVPEQASAAGARADEVDLLYVRVTLVGDARPPRTPPTSKRTFQKLHFQLVPV